MRRRFLVFRISSDYGMFRRLYTTTSPQTYPFPTGTAISGLLASIIGIGYDEYYNKYLKLVFNSPMSEYGIQILGEIDFIRINENWIETKQFDFNRMLKAAVTKSYEEYINYQRMQASLSMIRNPKYRLFVSLPEDVEWNGKKIFDLLIKNVENNTPHYIPYMGISECIAHIKFEDVIYVEKEILNEFVEVSSVVPILSKDFAIDVEEMADSRLGRESIPRNMESDRKVSKYVDVIYEYLGKPIRVKGVEAYNSGKYGLFATF